MSNAKVAFSNSIKAAMMSLEISLAALRVVHEQLKTDDVKEPQIPGAVLAPRAAAAAAAQGAAAEVKQESKVAAVKGQLPPKGQPPAASSEKAAARKVLEAWIRKVMQVSVNDRETSTKTDFFGISFRDTDQSIHRIIARVGKEYNDESLEYMGRKLEQWQQTGRDEGNDGFVGQVVNGGQYLSVKYKFGLHGVEISNNADGIEGLEPTIEELAAFARLGVYYQHLEDYFTYLPDGDGEPGGNEDDQDGQEHEGEDQEDEDEEQDEDYYRRSP